MLCKLRYAVTHPIRLLLPLAIVLNIIPIFVEDIYQSYFLFPIFYFFGSYFILLNFPCIVESLHKSPKYFEDLIVQNDNLDDNTFQRIYTIVMNLLLAIVFAALADYVIIQGVEDKSFVELSALIGGNVFLFMKIQNQTGKILVSIFYTCRENKKIREQLKNTLPPENIEIEMKEIENNTQNIN